ncbi:MAG: hypothetical protein NC907_02380, partial [Candidatus Omnitrophica bacterium]|nr:hypothetical protein [Candidatus Omnitrophota bacterium]
MGILISILNGCNRAKQLSSESIDEKMLQEAIEYGRAKSGISLYEFTEPWSVYLGYEVGKGRAVYLSPFLQAAQLAKNAEEKRVKPDINIIKKVVAAKMNTLNFLVTIYGNEPDAPRRTKAYLIYNNARIDPIYAHFPPFGEFNRDYYQQINGEVSFPARNIPRNAIVKLCIEISPKKEKEAEQHHESAIVVGDVTPARILTEFTFDLS